MRAVAAGFSAREKLMLAALMGPIAMELIDSGMLAGALPQIQSDFGVRVDLLSWAVAAAFLPRVALMPVYGRIGDVFGHRRLDLIGLAVHASGSLLSSIAPSFARLVAGRLLQGMGGSSLPLSMALIADSFPADRRGRALGWWNSAAPFGIIVGPVLGGIIVESLGWQAIPSLNDLGLSIPMAIDAGFGEQGRNGKLITPEFGPSVRLCKVFTDLPLARDHPVRFGVTEFCEACNKCAETCPAKAIPTGGRAWSGPNLSNNPGVRTWHLDNEACRRYWALGPADNCTVCVRACPFTKGCGWVHDLTRTAIAHAPALNPVWRALDDMLGYGREKDAAEFWRQD